MNSTVTKGGKKNKKQTRTWEKGSLSVSLWSQALSLSCVESGWDDTVECDKRFVAIG